MTLENKYQDSLTSLKEAIRVYGAIWIYGVHYWALS